MASLRKLIDLGVSLGVGCEEECYHLVYLYLNSKIQKLTYIHVYLTWNDLPWYGDGALFTKATNSLAAAWITSLVAIWNEEFQEKGSHWTNIH